MRVDDGSGWTDTILMAPCGPIQRPVVPGSDRTSHLTNTGTAVQLTGTEMAWVGVDPLRPSRPQLAPDLNTLLSSGRSFNSIDTVLSSSWRHVANRPLINRASGRRTSTERTAPPAPGSRFLMLHQAPGSDRRGQPSTDCSGTRL